ncbi:DUF4870 domain-containing protein [Siphonobacter curvatus]|uniref:DUF4870 domain-containing protein n=1 Tax=Siphonobacter curvatus TaxID=2094562 RepID=A0A2S7IME6_9BACT|nr:DUF4870 domain-containing protein [Siphonobacter curvatus]PQA58897.1 DUF4870 domain-containing protein [Siphonobacter curvatus]
MDYQPLPPSQPPMSESDARTWAMLAHLSSIVASFLGGLSFLGPLIVWLIYRERSTYVDYHGKEALNFQILMSIAFVGCIILGILTCGVGLIILPVVAVLDIVFVVIAAIKANNGEYYQYPFNWRIVK